MRNHLNLKRLPFLFLSLSLVLAACGAPILPDDSALPKGPVLGNNDLSGFVVEVNAGDNQQTTSVTLSDLTGNEITPGTTLSEHAISDNELRSFGIDGQNGLVDFFHNMGAADIFKACVNECGDWKFSDHPDHQPVNVKLAFQSASVLDFKTQNTALASEDFNNESSTATATYNTSLAVTKSNSSTTSWSNSNSFTFTQSIKYKIGFLGTGGGGSTGLAYNHSWGEGGSETSSTTIGTTSGVQVTLQPKQHVKAILSATQGTMRVRVVYAATITSGEVVTWNGDFSTGEIVQSFSEFAPLISYFSRPTTVLITQDMDIGYYSGGKIDITDGLGNVLSNRPTH